MKNPRLIYYNDAHHYHAKRIDPPLSLPKLQWPVDEVSGTGVDLLAFGLGYGDVYFHDSKVGRVVGQKQEVWQSLIDWRIMRMVQEAKKMGTDQVREVIKRGREKEIPVFPSLKLQDGATPGTTRCGSLKWEHSAAVCIGGPEGDRERWGYNYANELVRKHKLAVIREMLEDYRADGIELDFTFGRRGFFRRAEVEKHIPLMTRFIAQIKAMAEEISKDQGREIAVMARVGHKKEDNLRIGLDVEEWLNVGSIDLVVGRIPGSCLETGVVAARWLADAANAGKAAAYLSPPRKVYDERTIFPHIEMFRALGQTVRWQGFAGLYLRDLPWPLSETEYQILREAALPDVIARHDKRYILGPLEGDESNPTTPERQLPLKLEEGKSAAINILVADDLEGARQDGEMRVPLLTIRFSNFCIEDEIEIRFNGKVLPVEDAEITDERALKIPAQFPYPVMAPSGFAAHWFRYRLAMGLLKQGENTLEIEIKKLTKTADWSRCVNGVEIQTRYKDFVRPQGLGVNRVAPL